MDSLTIVGQAHNYSIGLMDDSEYNPYSSDNVVAYGKFYSEKVHEDYHYLPKHGVFVLRDGEIVASSCVCSSGGSTGIHPRCFILGHDRIAICCGDNVFCLKIPDLGLIWNIKVDSATCFEIFKLEDSYIVHGELEISRLDAQGKVVWKFSGSDIFTTTIGKNDFTFEAGVIEAVNWEGRRFYLDALTGKELKKFET